MKHFYTFIFMIAFISAAAAEYEYVPLVREGVQWTYLCEYMDYDLFDEKYPYVEVLEIKGDENVDGITYKQVVSNLYEQPVALIREDDKKIYVKYSDEEIGTQINLGYNEQTGEYLIYDFNKPSAGYAELLPGFRLTEEMIEIDGTFRKAYCYEDTKAPLFIEGIGILFDYSPFFRPFDWQPDNATSYTLTHVFENGNTVYKTDNHSHYEYFMNNGVSVYYCDVNHDHNVNVADVSEYFKRLIIDDTAKDINGDGEVNVGDVSALYSIIME